MRKGIIIGLLVCICGCNNLVDKSNSDNQTHQPSSMDFNKEVFSNRAEELTYIREYLKYKLPQIFVKKYPEQMKKVQYSLIVQGENPTLEDAARKSIMFSNQYQMLMSRYISENSTFKTVKVQLENFDQYKKDWAKKERESEFDKIIDVFKSYTINRIHDINKHNIIKDNLEGGYTVADYFEKQNPKRKIEYQKLKTKNPNVFRIVIEVSENDTPFSLNIFEYDFVSKQFTHIETIQQQDLINAD